MRIWTVLPAAVFAFAAAGAVALTPDYEAEGGASWYGQQFHGRKTASGERFDMNAYTAAHRTLPLGSIVEVTNLDNDRTVKVRVNDRGPFKASRIIDVSREAADELGFLSKGLARVRVKYVGPAGPDGLRPKVIAEPETVVEDPLDQTLVLAAAPTSSASPVEPTAAPAAAATIVAAAATLSAPAPGEARYAIQVGAFSKRANADRAADTLDELAVVEIRPLELRGMTLHRVLVGAYADKSDAQAALSKIAKAGFADAQVVKAF